MFGLGNIGDFALGAVGLGYNIYSNERQRGDYLKQQNFHNQFVQRQQDHHEHVTANAAQIRRNDMEAAGFHPTLAAGGAASTTQAHAPQKGAAPNAPQDFRIMQNALMGQQIRQLKAQVDQTEAEASAIRARERREDRRYEEIELPGYGLKSEAHSWQRVLHPLEVEAKRVGIDRQIVDTAIQRLERDYMRTNMMKMPTRRSEIGEIVAAFERILRDLRTPESKIKGAVGSLRERMERTGDSITEWYRNRKDNRQQRRKDREWESIRRDMFPNHRP